MSLWRDSAERSTQSAPVGLTLAQVRFAMSGKFMVPAVLCLCQLLQSCTAPASQTIVLDLVEGLPFATRVSEEESINFDSPTLGKNLVQGWSKPRRNKKSGRLFVWSLGDQARIEFTSLANRELELQFSCRPARSPTGAKQQLSFSLNGIPFAEIDLAKGMKTYRVGLDRSNLRPGTNRIEIQHAYSWSNAESRAPRQLAVAWYAIRFAGAQPAKTEPRSDPASGTLFIPTNSQLDFYFRLSANSFLQIQGVEGKNRWNGSLTIEVAQDGDEARSLALLSEPDSNLNLRLNGSLDQPMRLTLRASDSTAKDAEHADNEGEGFLLARPRVVDLSPLDTTLEKATPVQPIETERSVSKLPSILIYLVDTLRSDHLGCYGYPRDISPRIDAFAADSILFEEAVGQSTWTRPAVATLLTGLWPVAHGVNQGREKLSSEALTLAEVLRDAGYRTAAFVSNPNVSGTFGFRQGFEEFFQLQGQPKVRSDVITDRVVRWLDAQSSGAPTFLYVHTADPHNPYLAPEPYRSIYAPTSEREIEEITSNPKKQSWEPTKEVLSSLQDLYDAEIAFTDDSFGNLLDYLRASKMYENTVILFVSDHGEEFAEHGAWTHGKNLHVETLRIPLIARFPEITTGQRIPTYVQQADVFPTILDYLGIGFDPSALDGRSLLHLIDPSSSTAPKPTEPIFSYLHRYGAPSVSVVYDGWKLMQRRSLANPPFRHLYELSSDPHETENLAATLPIRVGYLAALIQRKLADTHHLLSSEEVEIDPELEKSLEALGYLQ